jgi:hypothetical protein
MTDANRDDAIEPVVFRRRGLEQRIDAEVIARRIRPLARIRRKRQRLPASRCIESAQTHRARVCSLLTRASDTTLRLLGSNRPSMSALGFVINRESLLTTWRFSVPTLSHSRTFRIE